MMCPIDIFTIIYSYNPFYQNFNDFSKDFNDIYTNNELTIIWNYWKNVSFNYYYSNKFEYFPNEFYSCIFYKVNNQYNSIDDEPTFSFFNKTDKNDIKLLCHENKDLTKVSFHNRNIFDRNDLNIPIKIPKDGKMYVWFYDNKYHRENAPAIIIKDENKKIIYKEWYKHGNKYNIFQNILKLFKKENNKKEYEEIKNVYIK